MPEVIFTGPAGRIEGRYHPAKQKNAPIGIVLHPHPQFGGTMNHQIVYQLYYAFVHRNFSALRFNFRGAGLSQGEHDKGVGEVDDVRTALDWLDHEFHRPIVFAGFSFGAAVGLRVACPDPRVAALISLGTPISPVDDRSYDYDFLHTCAKPKLFVSGSRDQFASKPKLEALVATVPEPKKLVIIEAADHFFEGRLREMREAVESWARDIENSSKSV